MNGDCQTLPLYQGSGWPFVLLSTAAPPQAPGLPIYRRYRTLLIELIGIGVPECLADLACNPTKERYRAKERLPVLRDPTAGITARQLL